MDWLEARLRELPGRKNKAGAAKAIDVPPSRISEIVKGLRQVQQNEWVPLAQYLEWTVDELMSAVSRIPNGRDKVVVLPPRPGVRSTVGRSQVVQRQLARDGDERLVPVRSAKELPEGDGTFVLTQRVIDELSVPGQGEESYAFYVQTDDAHPYERGDRLLVDPDQPIVKGKHVVLLTTKNDKGEEHGLVRTLVDLSPTTWTVQWYVLRKDAFHRKTVQLSRKDWPHCHRIVGVRHP